MQVTVYNTGKHRLETIDVEFTVKNTTWFDDRTGTDIVYRITDFKDGLIIKKNNYEYPIWFYDVTRMDIDYNWQKAEALLASYE